MKRITLALTLLVNIPWANAGFRVGSGGFGLRCGLHRQIQLLDLFEMKEIHEARLISRRDVRNVNPRNPPLSLRFLPAGIDLTLLKQYLIAGFQNLPEKLQRKIIVPGAGQTLPLAIHINTQKEKLKITLSDFEGHRIIPKVKITEVKNPNGDGSNVIHINTPDAAGPGELSQTLQELVIDLGYSSDKYEANDLGRSDIPKGCSLHALGVNFDKTLVFVNAAFTQLDELNLAAFFLHEALSNKWAKSLPNHDSTPLRRIVGSAFLKDAVLREKIQAQYLPFF